MEITFDTLINLLGLILGGGSGAFFTWRYMKKKAKAEAESAEVDMAQKVQDTYQQMLKDKDEEMEDKKKIINELREERDHFKNDRNELRERVSKMEKNILDMKREIARNGRKLEALSPFICARQGCHDRIFAQVSADGEVKPRKQKNHEIEPNNEL